MRRVSVAALAVSSVALLVGVVATPAAFAAPNSTCTGTLAAGTYQNVTVPTGATCSIDSSNVILGNVTVGRDASFQGSGVSIGGNVSGDHAANVFVGGSVRGNVQADHVGQVIVGGSVGGNVTATATSGPAHSFMCNATIGGNVAVQGSGPGADWFIGNLCGPNPGLTIGGNLTVQNNASRVEVQGNNAHGNISVDNNSGGGSLIDNTAGGNCQLFNDNPPYFGDSNSVPAGHQNTCNPNA